MLTFHLTFWVALHRNGTFVSVLVPSPRGPRNCGQFSAEAHGAQHNIPINNALITAKTNTNAPITFPERSAGVLACSNSKSPHARLTVAALAVTVSRVVKRRQLPCALTIAGSDSGGGAGIQADLKTFAALNVHGASVVTCLTAQNPKRVLGVFPATPEFVTLQLQAISSEL